MDYAGNDGSEGVINPEGLDSRMEYNKIKLILGFAFPTKEKEEIQRWLMPWARIDFANPRRKH